ncbi:hypothetical protein Tco_0428434 [Tanacetum coccineum]
MLGFLSNYFISTALTIKPSAIYVEYLREFWYSEEVDEATKTIIFSLSSVKKPLTFTRDEFITAIGIPICSNVVPLPLKETVRAGLAASFLKPLASEVRLTSHMLKVAKVSQELEPSLILSSEKVNADDTTDKSSSRTSMQPVRVILPKTQVAETQHAEETVATANATKSLDTSESVKEQVNKPKTTEAEKVTVYQNVQEEVKEFGLESMEDVTFDQITDEIDQKNKDSKKPESPFDTELKIKIIK